MPARTFTTAALLLCSTALSPALAEPADLPLAQLTLYSSGVGYFEHVGPVSADDSVTLAFSAEQLNDVLKSLLIRGSAGPVAVTYPGEEPVSQRLAGFGINVAGNTPLPALLQQLRGVAVKATLVGETQPITGRVIGLQDRQRAVGNPPIVLTETLLTLSTAQGLRTLSLDQIETLTLDDPALQQELDKALALLGSTRDRDEKPLTITFEQPSDQTAVSYLLEMPLWKVSYRLDMGNATDDKPLLQGWAIVDNTTDADWDNVAVTLVSGRPVSFIQNLYSPEFLQRPTIRPERFAGLKPQQYDKNVASVEGYYADAAMEAMPMPASPSSAPAPAMTPMFSARQSGNALKQLQSQVAPAAAAADLGEMFAYTIDQPLTLPRGGSAMLPIVNDAVAATPLSIYNSAVQPKHPLRGVRLTNTTSLKLDAGPVTVIDDGAYAGDAQLGFLAPGDDRLLSYGLDLELTADASQTDTTQLTTAIIRKGVLELRHSTRHEHTYTFQSAAGKDRTVLIEHPRVNGRDLLQPAPDSAGLERTDALYRFPLTVPAGKAAKLTVIESTPYLQTVQLIDHNADQLLFYASNGKTPQPVREALERIADARRAMDDTQRSIAPLEQTIQEITAEQDRIRQNMNNIDRNASLYKRYMTKLDEQETTLEQSNASLAQLREQLTQQQSDLADTLAQLTIE